MNSIKQEINKLDFNIEVYEIVYTSRHGIM
jgi:hypothetical protein